MLHSQPVAELFATGRAVDGILALMLIESIALILIGRKLRRPMPAAQVLVSIGAGAALLLALRAALLGFAWQWISLCLMAALAAHLLDLRYRWAEAQRPGA
jgi:low temperature requirement protein LtrA